MKVSLRNLENQVGQLARNLSRRPHGGLPSNIEKNLIEEVNAVTLRNGRELEEIEREPRKKMEKDKKAVEETLEIDKYESSKETPKVSEALKVSTYKPKIPLPARLKQQQPDQQFSKFLETFKKLHINIPFY